MMCAHHPSAGGASLDRPAHSRPGRPSVLGAIIYPLFTLFTLAAIVVCVGPLWDWLATWVLTFDSPLVSTVMPLFKWLWLIIALSVGAAFAYVYLVVIRKIRYNRLMGGLE
jgi:hypothetical protein